MWLFLLQSLEESNWCAKDVLRLDGRSAKNLNTFHGSMIANLCTGAIAQDFTQLQSCDRLPGPLFQLAAYGDVFAGFFFERNEIWEPGRSDGSVEMQANVLLQFLLKMKKRRSS